MAFLDAENPIITLTTDFGDRDNYVGIVKGIITRINPRIHLIDISNNIPPFNIPAAYYLLMTAYRSFPEGTIHLAVVDPGVGTERRAIAIETGDCFFVGPDNGLFSFLKKSDIKSIVELNNRKYFSTNIPATFHGRDLFAPAAGLLSQGVAIEELGGPAKKLTGIAKPSCRRIKGGLSGRVIYIDRFGNLVSSIREENIGDRTGIVKFAGERIGFLKRTFGEAEPGQALGYINSFGYLEIGVNLGSAENHFRASYGDKIQILFASR